MGDQVEMFVKVQCGTVLGDEFAVMLKMRPTMHFDNHLGPVSRATSTWRIRLLGVSRNGHLFAARLRDS